MPNASFHFGHWALSFKSLKSFIPGPISFGNIFFCNCKRKKVHFNKNSSKIKSSKKEMKIEKGSFSYWFTHLFWSCTNFMDNFYDLLAMITFLKFGFQSFEAFLYFRQIQSLSFISKNDWLSAYVYYNKQGYFGNLRCFFSSHISVTAPITAFCSLLISHDWTRATLAIKVKTIERMSLFIFVWKFQINFC